MAYEFHLPADIADAGAEGFVVNWFKEPGQIVRAGELLLEVQFDKVTTEIYAPVNGVLIQIVVPQGEVIKPGQLLCLIQQDVARESATDTPTNPPPSTGTELPAETPPREVRATPAARRLARELGILLENVQGTGPGGRITEDDVRAFASASAKVPSGARRERLSPAQRLTGQRMLESLQRTAQFTLGREVEVTALVNVRQKFKRAGSHVTLTDLFHRAVVIALTRHPRLQAVLEGDELVFPSGIHLGFAVSRGEDLLVPVIREAHRLGVEELAAERRRLTAAVSEGRVQAEDLRGATFTVSNLGPYGVDFFTPVLNPPQSGILGLGRVVERPVLDQGQVRSGLFLTLSLTVDHRVINGAPAAAFLAELAELLAAPEGWVAHA